VNLFEGLSPEGYMLINTSRTFDELGMGDFVKQFRSERLLTVPASELAREHVGRPIPNAALLGGFAAISGAVTIGSVASAIRDRFSSRLAEGNVAAAEAAFEFVRTEMQELSHA
jgi:pyruvate ferredoxin oxidoreductase gamma subunit